ncbi:hypothetical protein HGA91_05645 [candidate division WWE3 bacterium]|nr:hypothetical protein [candidate division WWE3 bacterium]
MQAVGGQHVLELLRESLAQAQDYNQPEILLIYRFVDDARSLEQIVVNHRHKRSIGTYRTHSVFFIIDAGGIRYHIGHNGGEWIDSKQQLAYVDPSQLMKLINDHFDGEVRIITR